MKRERTRSSDVRRASEFFDFAGPPTSTLFRYSPVEWTSPCSQIMGKSTRCEVLSQQCMSQ